MFLSGATVCLGSRRVYRCLYWRDLSCFDLPGRIPLSAILRFACYRATSVVRLSTLCLDSTVPATCQSVQDYQRAQNPRFFSPRFLFNEQSLNNIQRILRNRQRAELVFQPAVMQICNLTAKGPMHCCLHLFAKRMFSECGVSPTQALGP